MVYRRSISTVSQAPQYQPPSGSVLQDRTGHEIPDSSAPNAATDPRLLSSHEEEDEIALFGRVRIKTAIRSLDTRSVADLSIHPDDMEKLREAHRLEIERSFIRDPRERKPVTFEDALARKFSFPFKSCYTWAVSTA
jgi:hypothetical protein